MSLALTTPNTDYAKATSNINAAIATVSYPFAISSWYYNHGTSYPITLNFIRSGGSTSLFEKIDTGPVMYGMHFDGTTSQGGVQTVGLWPGADQWIHTFVVWSAVNTVSRICINGVDKNVTAQGSAATTLGTIDELGAGLGLGTGKVALYGLYAGATSFSTGDTDQLAGIGTSSGVVYSPELVHASECKHSWSFDKAVHGASWLNDRVGSATMALQGAATNDDSSMPAGTITYSSSSPGRKYFFLKSMSE